MASKAPRKAYKPLFESAIRKAQRLIDAVRDADDAKDHVLTRIKDLQMFIENETDPSFKSPAAGTKVPVKAAAAGKPAAKKAPKKPLPPLPMECGGPDPVAYAAEKAAAKAAKAARRADKKAAAAAAVAAMAAEAEAEADEIDDDDDEDADEFEDDGDDSEVARNLAKDMDACKEELAREAEAGC